MKKTHAHSKQLFAGHLHDACAKTSDIVLIKIMTSAPGVEVRIAFLICYLESLYKIELGHNFCSESVRMQLTKTFWLTRENLCKQTQ